MPDLNTLGLDTSGQCLALCLLTRDGQLYAAIRRVGLKHAELLMPLVDTLLSDASIPASDLDLLVCSKGPGSFTGLRIGLATAKGISLATGCPLVSVATLDVMVYGLSYFKGAVVPIVDAKKGRVYSAIYKEGKRISDYLDLSPQELRELLFPEDEILFTGPDQHLMKTQELNKHIFFDTRHSDSFVLDIISLGLEQFRVNGPDQDDGGPLYVRSSDAEISLKAQKIK